MDYRKEMLNMYNSEIFQQLSEYYRQRSMMDILGVARQESVHSNFIAWLLTPSEGNTCGTYAMECFLRCIVRAKLHFRANAGANFSNEALLTSLITNDYSIDSINVSTEKSITGNGEQNGKRRIDILLEVRLNLKFDAKDKILPIVIENKVKSKEHGEQTVEYYNWAVKEYEDRSKYFEPLFVFLTPNGNDVLNNENCHLCKSHAYIMLNYQSLVDFVIEPCLRKASLSEEKKLMADYLRCLSFANFSCENPKGKEIVMAIQASEKELLKRFWQSNKALLSVAMAVLADDDDTTSEEREAFRKVSQATATRDYTKYRFQNEGENKTFGKRGIVEEVVRRYLEQNPNISLNDFKKAFPDNLHVGGFSQLPENAQDRSRFFEVELGGGTVVLVSNQWGIDNINPFLRRAQELGFLIETC